MNKNYYLAGLMISSLLIFSGCGMSFGGSADPGQTDGPGSGPEGDLPEDRRGPDSGEDYDTTIPGAPDSGDEIEPGSGDPGQTDGPGSGPEGDLPEVSTGPDSGEDYTARAS